jgi:hypothetical protein
MAKDLPFCTMHFAALTETGALTSTPSTAYKGSQIAGKVHMKRVCSAS